MAILQNAQAEELLTKQLNKTQILRAIEHEERLILHCEPIQHKDNLPQSYRRILGWIETLLTPDKFMRFQQLLRTPIETVESTETIFDELSKLFQADDKFIKFDFVSNEIEEDANEYARKIKDSEFWETKGWDAMKTAVNSILVVDLPAVQTTERPEPYYYLVPICNVLDVCFDKECSKVEYIAYKQDEKTVIILDDWKFRTYVKKEDSDDYKLFAEAIHSTYTEAGDLIEGLGYCPAASFMGTPIEGSNGVDNKGPVSGSLSKLDWLLFWRTSKKYLDLYGAWPIFVTYTQKCDYKDENDNFCIEGYINYEETGAGGVFVPKQKPCPHCAQKSVIGPGSWWEVDPPADKDDVDLMKNPVHIVEISNDKLEYCVAETDRQENEIYLDCVGWDGDAMANKAVNETQVAANFQSKDNVLNRWKSVFERSRKFAMDTVYRLRYGDYFLRSTVNYGTEYFLQTPEQLTEQYNKAKTAGLPMYMLSGMRERIARTQNRNNPEELERNFILAQLEPYPDLGIAQVASMGIAQTDPAGYILKLNFPTFIQRFERENTNIIEFGSLIPFNTKIDIILQTLKDYGKEQQNSIPQPDPGPNAGA